MRAEAEVEDGAALLELHVAAAERDDRLAPVAVPPVPDRGAGAVELLAGLAVAALALLCLEDVREVGAEVELELDVERLGEVVPHDHVLVHAVGDEAVAVGVEERAAVEGDETVHGGPFPARGPGRIAG